MRGGIRRYPGYSNRTGVYFNRGRDFVLLCSRRPLSSRLARVGREHAGRRVWHARMLHERGGPLQHIDHVSSADDGVILRVRRSSSANAQLQQAGATAALRRFWQ